jgi:hypothetical protein
VSDCYDRAGEPITMGAWSRLHRDDDYRTVELTDVGGYRVSTVWLGLDHGFGYSERPLIFETMVFGDDSTDLACRRYSTEDEARAGHAEQVAEVELIQAATQ